MQILKFVGLKYVKNITFAITIEHFSYVGVKYVYTLITVV